LEGKPDGERPLETPMRKWEDNIKMGIQKIKWRGRRIYYGSG